MANINEAIKNAKTILWNGPVGVFEFNQFAAGTKSMAEAIASSEAFSVAGGGDTISSIQKFGVRIRSPTSPLVVVALFRVR